MCEAIPLLVAAPTAWTVPLPAVLLATPGSCVTGATALGPPTVPLRDTAVAAIPADPCTVLRLTLVLGARVAPTPESSQNPFRRMHVRYVA
jgi:hypothetical protein